MVCSFYVQVKYVGSIRMVSMTSCDKLSFISHAVSSSNKTYWWQWWICQCTRYIWYNNFIKVFKFHWKKKIYARIWKPKKTFSSESIHLVYFMTNMLLLLAYQLNNFNKRKQKYIEILIKEKKNSWNKRKYHKILPTTYTRVFIM